MCKVFVCLSGEPPSQVELTNVSKPEENGIRVEWKPPSIPNGVIQSYRVEVQLLNKEGHFVFTKNYTVMVGGWLHVCVHERISTYFLYSFAGKYNIVFLQPVACEQ